jgi:hypothetical protein
MLWENLIPSEHLHEECEESKVKVKFTLEHATKA